MFTIQHILAIGAIVIPSYLFYTWYGHGLYKYKGPFVASFTDLWRIFDVWFVRDSIPFYYLHQRYGPVVRLGPKKLSFASPAAVRDIYGSNGLSQKSDMHLVAQQTARGQAFQSLFATTDTAWHDQLKRKVNSAFSLTSMMNYEHFIDETIDALLTAFEQRFADVTEKSGLADFPEWLHYYSQDAVTCITYGKRMGFLEHGDRFGLISKTTDVLKYVGIYMNYPLLDRLLWKNPVLLWLNRHGFLNRPAAETVPFAVKAQAERRKFREQVEHGQHNNAKQMDRQTLTDEFFVAHQEHPDIVGTTEVLALGLSILAAGSDSTAATLAALFYYVLKNPQLYSKLQNEIDASFPGTSYISFRQAQDLKYLSAVVKETFRMHPAASWAPERVVSQPHGHVIAGEHIPAGTVVGISAWTLHRDPDNFGADAFEYKPERWLEADGQRLTEMENNLFHFGRGKFMCIGKNIALMEIYKLVPALIRRFDLRLENPSDTLKFVLPGGFVNVRYGGVRIKRRV